MKIPCIESIVKKHKKRNPDKKTQINDQSTWKTKELHYSNTSNYIKADFSLTLGFHKKPVNQQGKRQDVCHVALYYETKNGYYCQIKKGVWEKRQKILH